MLNEDRPKDRWRGAKIAFSLIMQLCVIGAAVAALIAHNWIVFVLLVLLATTQVRFNARMIRSRPEQNK
jgi:hypothetical protein